MKLVMDEKLKHRLIGLAVIISLGAIFAPAILKKSSQQLDTNLSVNVKLPPKPLAPNIVMNDDKDVFETIKVAKVNIAAVSDDDQIQELAHAQTISSEVSNELSSSLAQTQTDVTPEPVTLAVNQAAQQSAKHYVAVTKTAKAVKPAPVVAVKKPVASKPVAVAKAKAAVKPSAKTEMYAVQLASFSQLNNAQALVSKLNSKGYKAKFIKISGANGPIYKVYAGHSPRKVDVLKLKSQLASSMQLNGFVVNTGVS